MSQNAGSGSKRDSNVRWSILRENLRNHGKKTTEQKKLTRRPTGGFGFVEVTRTEGENVGEWEINQYHLSEDTTILLRQRREDSFVLDDFRVSNDHRIDNTGVVCLWPAEEVLTHFCSANKELFKGKRVLELGSGVGLAGLAVASLCAAAEVVLTDGNPTAVQVLQENIARNRAGFKTQSVRAELLHWGDYTGGLGPFDIVIAADCTFFSNFHCGLVSTLLHALSSFPSSTAFVLSPPRHGTLDHFAELARQEGGMETNLSEKYNEQVWRRHVELVESQGTPNMGWAEYQLETCFPLMLQIRKAPKTINWYPFFGAGLALCMIYVYNKK